MEMGNEHGFSVSFHFPFPVEMGNENENSAKIPEMGNENGALTLLATQISDDVPLQGVLHLLMRSRHAVGM